MLSQAWMIMAITFAIQTIFTVESTSVSDKIVKLPGQPKVSFQQFSGYITVDENKQRSLFYYFVEAEKHPSSKPLVIWLNGGPGCSSIGGGAFAEHGPFRPRRKILVQNDYSWNKEANMLYLESPAGVGFSYSANKSFYSSVNDEFTARDNLAFLERWFEKYPEYKNRDFFITGESYAGHYVPQLAELILQSKVKFNLKGIAIGNPLLDSNVDFNSRADYLWSHGLISDATFDQFTRVCNFSQIRRQTQNGNLTPEVTNKIDVCVEDEAIVYLNRKDVQTALHARLLGVTEWSFCSEVLHYDWQNLELPMVPVLASLIKFGIKVFVYSGDQDSVIPLTGTRTLVNGLAKELGLNTTVTYRAWFEGRQVAGWTQVYGKDALMFATIRGASHEAPFSQPERSLALFRGFLRGKPLPPQADKVIPAKGRTRER